MHKCIFLIHLLLLPLSIYSQAEKKTDTLSIKLEITGVYPPHFIHKVKESSRYFTRIEITNQTDSILTLWTPKCWWGPSWVFDSKDFTFNDWGCDSNGFQEIELKPKASTIFYGTVYSKKRPHDSVQFKIGYLMLNREEWSKLLMSDMQPKERKEFLKDKKVYWSNEVTTRFENNTFNIND
jgi:hypothetical protein